MDSTHKALCIVKAIAEFIAEHESSYTKPTTVHMTEEQREIVSKSFPYLISGEFYCCSDEHKMKIILSDPKETAVGVGYVYFTEEVDDYK